ncbi:hypothetical protein VTJ04DRAFT_2064 [Mycothermus thermophilus]|uniref:uncharacterized protein n=1 Tax=Humicola insolens TaxID=85995 RepID=UPI0037423F27
MSNPVDKPGRPARALPAAAEDNQSQPRSTETMRRPCRIRIKRPEPGSLYDILHEHAGTSLYVPPICWTDQHSELLGARFVPFGRQDRPVPDLAPDAFCEPTKLASSLTADLQTLLRMETNPAKVLCKTRALKHILSTFFPDTLNRPKTGAELNLYFGTRAFRRIVRIPCLWKSTGSPDFGMSFDSCPTQPATSFTNSISHLFTAREPGLPMLAYLNKSQLASIRKNLYGVARGPGGAPNEPVSRLQQLRAKMLVPADPEQDPYIVAVMLAMAQAHFYREPSSSSRSSSQGSASSGGSNGRRSVRIALPEFKNVRVQVIMHNEDGDISNACFYVYSATVTANFLERFLTPHKAPKPDEWGNPGTDLEIRRVEVPMWPILGLKERLARALGDEIAGDAIYEDVNHIGMWGALVLPPPRQPQYHFLPPVPSTPYRRKDRRDRKERKERKDLMDVNRSPKRRREADDELPPSSSAALTSSSTSLGSTSSFTSEPRSSGSSSPEDCPVLSPAAKRRRTARPVSTLEVC